MIKVILTSLLIVLAPLNSEVARSIQNGDSKTLANLFSSNIELTIQKNEGTYSKIQAEQIVKKFFTTHPVIKYSTVHQGNAKDGSSFEIGKLQTKAGSFRTYFLVKGDGVNQKVHQLRIEDDNE